MNALTKIVAAILVTTLTNRAIAHPGHDHTNWDSALIHAAYILPVLALLTIIVMIAKKKI